MEFKKNSIEKYLKQCIEENNVDVAVLSETDGIDFSFLKEWNEYSLAENNGGCDKIKIIINNNVTARVVQEASRYAIYSIRCPEKEYTLTGIHLQDRFSSPDPTARKETIRRIINDIKNAEDRIGCKRSIIIGDFNANPYEPELMGIDAFNAVLFKEIIKKNETRTFDGIPYRRFYNPIINYLGEGCYYGSFYHTNGPCTPVWHCLDQVIVGKELVDSILDLKYIKKIANTDLIKTVKPNVNISDHLPLFVVID